METTSEAACCHIFEWYRCKRRFTYAGGDRIVLDRRSQGYLQSFYPFCCLSSFPFSGGLSGTRVRERNHNMNPAVDRAAAQNKACEFLTTNAKAPYSRLRAPRGNMPFEPGTNLHLLPQTQRYFRSWQTDGGERWEPSMNIARGTPKIALRPSLIPRRSSRRAANEALGRVNAFSFEW